MKRFLFILFLVSICFVSCASLDNMEQLEPKEPVEKEVVEVVSEKNYEFIYEDTQSIKTAYMWVLDSFKAPKNVIQAYEEDMSMLLISAENLSTINLICTGIAPFIYNCKIVVKDNIVKVHFYNIRYGNGTPLTKYTIGLKGIYKDIDSLANNINAYFDKQ